jgi:uncharacterized protein YdeI (YjbR/CyaY-like superfamily)
MPTKPKALVVVLERHKIGLPYVVARLDAAALRKAWPEWANRRVKGEINGVALRTTLFPARQGAELVLVVNRKMQSAARVGPGDQVRLRLEPDSQPETEMPKELAAILKAEPALRRWFDNLPPSMQKGTAGYVDQARSTAARQKRAGQMAEMLALALEGEHESPPILRAAFERTPGAAAGWKAMTPLQRRNHLVGIFYVQTVEGRERRAEQAAQAALRVIERQRKRAL